ncbi:uncharacterized protein Dsimw501_GD27795, isoform B [Drosophila simulans]|uniref:Uncharacterized protein, isoform A n=1 Tax=Drosophila simulans TaxID=7240 RepID=A0A0J9RAN3_DROSI|nr:uncharacterized protein Dsimw501_GD27795, isoform A [Drosophila simulans]KMY92765.1 uncharacterized protein Dsimw501_GD27795, isoform B [Drosophila simulans]
MDVDWVLTFIAGCLVGYVVAKNT